MLHVSLSLAIVLGCSTGLSSLPEPAPEAPLQYYGEPQAPEQIVLVLPGNVGVPLKDWVFQYRFMESNESPGPVGLYRTKKSKDLFIEIESPEDKGDGEGKRDETSRRHLPARKIHSIQFITDEKRRLVKKVVIKMIDGETIAVPSIKPAPEFLSDAKYVFGRDLCPCVSLWGKATIEGKEETLRVLLNKNSPARVAGIVFSP